jgi:hypothetical protein
MAQAVQHELLRRRREGLLRSLASPHREAVAFSEIGLEDWGANLPPLVTRASSMRQRPSRYAGSRGRAGSRIPSDPRARLILVAMDSDGRPCATRDARVVAVRDPAVSADQRVPVVAVVPSTEQLGTGALGPELSMMWTTSGVS